MPMIIERGTNQLGRAAAGAAQLFLREREREDRLRREADGLKLADREFEFRQQNADRNFGLAQKRAEQQGAIFERDMSESKADGNFFRSKAVSLGADPSEIEGMSNEAVQNVANVLAYQEELKGKAGKVEGLANDVFERLGVGMADENGEVASDPFHEMIQSKMENAVTMGDIDEIQGLLMKAYETSHQAQIEVEQRAAAYETVSPLIDQMVGELPNQSSAKLRTHLDLFKGGHIPMSVLTKSLNEAAEMIDNKNSGGANGKLNPFSMERLKVAGSDMAPDEKADAYREIDRQAVKAGFMKESDLEKPNETKSSQSTGTTLSSRKIRKLIGSDALLSLNKDLAKLPEPKRENFVLNRIKRIGLEKNLSQEQILDLVESILDQST